MWGWEAKGKGGRWREGGGEGRRREEGGGRRGESGGPRGWREAVWPEGLSLLNSNIGISCFSVIFSFVGRGRRRGRKHNLSFVLFNSSRCSTEKKMSSSSYVYVRVFFSGVKFRPSC